MQQIAPPLCFLLAIALTVAGFSLLAVGLPETSVALHAARAGGDEAMTEQLEAGLLKEQVTYVALIAISFAGSLTLVLVGFRAMTPDPG